MKTLLTATFASVVALVSTTADAKPARVTQPGHCVREVSFGNTTDGALVIRSAWRCERSQAPNKIQKDKLVTR